MTRSVLFVCLNSTPPVCNEFARRPVVQQAVKRLGILRCCELVTALRFVTWTCTCTCTACRVDLLQTFDLHCVIFFRALFCTALTTTNHSQQIETGGVSCTSLLRQLRLVDWVDYSKDVFACVRVKYMYVGLHPSPAVQHRGAMSTQTVGPIPTDCKGTYTAT